MYPSKAEFDSIWLRDKGAGRGLPHRYQPLWFWFWLWLLMLTGIEAWPFFRIYRDIFAFEEKRRFWRSAEASIAIRYPLFFLKMAGMYWLLFVVWLPSCWKGFVSWLAFLRYRFVRKSSYRLYRFCHHPVGNPGLCRKRIHRKSRKDCFFQQHRQKCLLYQSTSDRGIWSERPGRFGGGDRFRRRLFSSGFPKWGWYNQNHVTLGSDNPKTKRNDANGDRYNKQRRKYIGRRDRRHRKNQRRNRRRNPGCGIYKEQINEALAAGSREAGYRIVPSRDLSGHGTEVLGIAPEMVRHPADSIVVWHRRAIFWSWNRNSRFRVCRNRRTDAGTGLRDQKSDGTWEACCNQPELWKCIWLACAIYQRHSWIKQKLKNNPAV